MRYTYLGPAGTFAEAALRTLAPGGVPAATVVAAIELVRRGEADRAVVPFENSVEGSVPSTLDELSSGSPLHVVGEVVLPVSFALLARPGTAISAVKTVATHPHAEAQCRRWLAASLPEATVVPASSTADGARLVAEGVFDAAVAAPVAAGHYGLVALAEDVHDTDGAVTRFVVVAQPGEDSPPTGRDRTSVVLFLSDDHPGALLEILTEFASRGVNLTRIESRPTGSGLGRYCFSIDLEGHRGEPHVSEALAALAPVCSEVRFLGSYPRAY